MKMHGCTRFMAMTLVEVLLVLVIVAIIAGLTIPYMGHYLEARRIEGAAGAVFSDLNVARTHATAQQVPVTVVFQTGSSWCVGITTGFSCDCSTQGACDLGQTDSTAFSNVSLSLSGFAGGTSTVFSATRGSAVPAGNVILTASSGTIQVQLSEAGFLKYCSDQGLGGYSAC